MRIIVIILSLLFANIAIAAPSNEGAALEAATSGPQVGYYNINPDFTTNVAGYANSKLHYIRLSVSVVVYDSNDIKLLKEHEPLIKDAIISILGSKQYSQIITQNGREELRAECRDKVAQIMEQKAKRRVVQDLLFLHYLYQ